MSKKRNSEDGPRINIVVGDEPPEPNPTLLAILRDGEKAKPGDPRGTLADRLGAEVQDYMREQARVARHRRTAVKGTVTLTIATVSGPDGSFTYAVDCKTKTAKIPPGVSMTFIDDDGELTGRPAEPLTELAYQRQRAAENKPTPAEPKVGPGSNL